MAKKASSEKAVDKKADKKVDKKLTKTVDAKVSKTISDTTSEKKRNEIDELFASKPKSKDTPQPTSDKATKPKKTTAPPTTADEDDWTDSKGERKKRRPTTAEGYPIYSVQEMKIGLGGDTPDCPFDCQCCF